MKEVEIYYNLHKKCLSVKEKGGKVIEHKNGVTIFQPKFVVQPGGRRRVISEKRKNVHAFIRGQLAPVDTWNVDTAGKFKLIPKLVIYNPYKHRYFMARGVEDDNLEPIFRAYYVTISDKQIIAWIKK